MFDELPTLDSAIVVVVHCLDDPLGFVGDDPVEDVLGPGHKSVAVFIGSPKNSRTGLGGQVPSVVDIFSLGVFSVPVDICPVELAGVTIECPTRRAFLLLCSEPLEHLGHGHVPDRQGLAGLWCAGLGKRGWLGHTENDQQASQPVSCESFHVSAPLAKGTFGPRDCTGQSVGTATPSHCGRHNLVASLSVPGR